VAPLGMEKTAGRDTQTFTLCEIGPSQNRPKKREKTNRSARERTRLGTEPSEYVGRLPEESGRHDLVRESPQSTWIGRWKDLITEEDQAIRINHLTVRNTALWILQLDSPTLLRRTSRPPGRFLKEYYDPAPSWF